MSGIRPFRREDIDEVVRLRALCFSHAHHQDEISMAKYFAEVFFESPWGARRRESLVFVSDTGQIEGFIGILSRRWRFKKQALDVAVPTQFLVPPNHRGLAGARLLKQLFQGPQDLILTDVANDTARGLFQRLGAETLLSHSLYFRLTIKPAKLWAERFSGSGPRQLIRSLARPLASVVDSARRGRQSTPSPPRTALQPSPLDPEVAAHGLASLVGPARLMPERSPEEFSYLLERVREKELGPAVGTALHDARGQLHGWFVVALGSDKVARLVEIVSRPNYEHSVLGALLQHIEDRGALQLRGRLEPAFLPALAAYEVCFHRNGPWTLIHTQSPELASALHSGTAVFGRLDGEWWLAP